MRAMARIVISALCARSLRRSRTVHGSAPEHRPTALVARVALSTVKWAQILSAEDEIQTPPARSKVPGYPVDEIVTVVVATLPFPLSPPPSTPSPSHHCSHRLHATLHHPPSALHDPASISPSSPSSMLNYLPLPSTPSVHSTAYAHRSRPARVLRHR
ncbi:hypothetical protein DFH08DRAFT_976177 [Mycena albidolilacea]|uniref:Uncharacterized protein n=1 Tax=Mycena albidolilacea TaxID=1033008 RepID=A0AAD6Z339_9AGAR|nr:hypothetical protein DFH08DRAFT_976177 [Mycena albidolilacea]